MSAWTCRSFDGKAAVKIVPPRPRIPWWKGLGADSEEKREPVSDIDTAAADSLKVLDPKRPIREADMADMTCLDPRPYMTCVRRRAGVPEALLQPRAAEAFQIMLHLDFLLNWHFLCDPGERNIRLRAA